MKTSQRDQAVLYILQYLRENSYEDRGVSAASILDYLSSKGIETDRRTVYSELKVLEQAGYPVHLVHKNNSYLYHIDHPFSMSDAFILMDAVQHNSILSHQAKEDLTRRLSLFLPALQRESMPALSSAPLLSNNENVPEALNILLKAIVEVRKVAFLYFDFTPDKKKAYRREGRPYILQPISVVSDQGRYYCIFWSEKHENFANYRIDKMDHIHLNEPCGSVPTFDADAYMRNSFNMYRGRTRTITLRIDNSLASIVFDTFGTDIMITACSRNFFTAIIHRPLVPTLYAWLFEFCDKLTVIEPADLKLQLKEKAQEMLKKLQDTEES